MINSAVCIMSFNTSLGGTRTIRVPNPVHNLSTMEGTGAAFRIIQANPFDANVGTLESVRGVEIVTTSRNILF